MNLLQETLEVLKRNNKTPNDVKFVKTEKCLGNWDEFAALANFEYDDGYKHGAEVETSLHIVGDNWWLSRGEYDGSEWWNFNTKPTKDTSCRKFHEQNDLKDRY